MDDFFDKILMNFHTIYGVKFKCNNLYAILLKRNALMVLVLKPELCALEWLY